MVGSIIEFFAHFHPLLVHLPIGILLIGIVLQLMTYRARYVTLKPAVSFLLLCGAVTAVISCITGYLLSITDDYDKNLVGWHQWMGISVALTSCLLYAKEKHPEWRIPAKPLAILVIILIMITGHLGGSLTHGSDYLTKPLADAFRDDSSTAAIKPLANAQEASAYNDVIKPIFETKCYACHGPNKQKGKLRLDDSLFILKGGKDGKVIAPGNADGSALIKRILLPVDNDDHMPPKEKPQPSENQIALLHWWISEGVDFSKKVKDISQTEKIKAALKALEQAPVAKKVNTDIPSTAVAIADEKIVDQLRESSIVVLPVAQNSNYLMANFVTDSLVDRSDLENLVALKKQLIWLKLGYTNIKDTQMARIGELNGLTRLSLEHTALTDAGIAQLKSLENLQYLNLVGTQVTAKGILQLKGLKKLLSIYLYHTNVRQEDWNELKNAFPTAKIDSGGYVVPFLPTDTIEVKAKQEY